MVKFRFKDLVISICKAHNASRSSLYAMRYASCAMLITFSACDKSRVYEQNIELNNEGWYIDSVLTFSFNIQDTNLKYNIYYNIRNANTYPFYNLYTRYYLEDSIGSTLSTYLYEMFLMDSKTGQSLGSGIGDIFDHRFELLMDHKFNTAGTYKIIIKQYMRQDPLHGILAVGIRVEIDDG